MIKIALYGETTEIAEIKGILSQCFKEKNISYKFCTIRSPIAYMTENFNDNEFKLQVSYLNGNV